MTPRRGPPGEGCKCPTCGKVKKQGASSTAFGKTVAPNPQSTLQQQQQQLEKWKDLANIQPSTKNLYEQTASSYLVVSYEDNVKLPLTMMQVSKVDSHSKSSKSAR